MTEALLQHSMQSTISNLTPAGQIPGVGSDGSGSAWLDKDVQRYYEQLEMMAGRASVRLGAIHGDNLDRLSIRVADSIKRATVNAQMALRCLEELEPTAMTRKRKTVRNFNDHAERESQLSAARVALDNVLAAFAPPNTEVRHRRGEAPEVV